MTPWHSSMPVSARSGSRTFIWRVSSDESKAINFNAEPKVIISASGMCEAGRIKHHLKHNLWRPECTVLIVGYQAYNTLGRSLIEGAEYCKLFGETIEIRAEIKQLQGISGHADKNGLLNWVKAFSPKPEMVFVVHGEDTVCDDFTTHASMKNTRSLPSLPSPVPCSTLPPAYGSRKV
ncbi:MAG: MBL fold metallo-hydrolase RNA specificity domain-containing protein [Clostridium sp.]